LREFEVIGHEFRGSQIVPVKNDDSQSKFGAPQPIMEGGHRLVHVSTKRIAKFDINWA
jgi:hypothetical protein